MKFIFANFFGLIATVAVTVTAQTCTPGLTRQVLPSPSTCTQYVVCAFGNPSTFTCPNQTPNFDACSLSCSTSNTNCFTCSGQTTTTVSGDTTVSQSTTISGVETTVSQSTTISGVDTTVSESTTISTSAIPTAPTVIPTAPTVP